MEKYEVFGESYTWDEFKKLQKDSSKSLNLISSKLVFTLKFSILNGTLTKAKSRLVCRGFED